MVQVLGMIGYSPVIRNMPQNYSILNRLVPITFQGGWWWGQAGFYQYYDLKNVTRYPSVDLTAYDRLCWRSICIMSSGERITIS